MCATPGGLLGEREKENVEVTRAFPEEIVDPDSSSVTQWKREVGSENAIRGLPSRRARPSKILMRARKYGSIRRNGKSHFGRSQIRSRGTPLQKQRGCQGRPETQVMTSRRSL